MHRALSSASASRAPSNGDMVPNISRAKAERIVGAAGKLARKQARKGLKLRHTIVNEKTESKYKGAVQTFFPWLTAMNIAWPNDRLSLDIIMQRYIEYAWEEGESKGYVGHAISGLTHFLPELKGFFKGSWRIYSAWSRIELPARAPPLPSAILFGLAGHAIKTGQLALGVCLLLFFHCFIRTGELLTATIDHLVVGTAAGVLSLPCTKSGQRTGAMEAVSIDSACVAAWASMWKTLRQQQAGRYAKIWPGSSAGFRKAFNDLLKVFDLGEWGFKPYSCRRGGATYFFQQTGSMELTLARGRWSSSRGARIYLNDGLGSLQRLP